MTSNNSTAVATPSLDLLQGHLSSAQIEKTSNHLADSKIGTEATRELNTNLTGDGTNHLSVQTIKAQEQSNANQSKIIQGTEQIGVVTNDDQNFVTSSQSTLTYQLTGNLAGTAGSQSLETASATTTLNVNDQTVPLPLRVVTVQATETAGGQNTLSSAPASVTYTVANVGSAGQVQGVFAAPGTENVGAVQQVANVTVESNTDGPKYTYYPAVQTADTPSGGQFYVMMSPQDMIPVSGQAAQRIIAPRAHSVTGLGEAQTFTVEGETAIPVEFRKVETGTRSSRDERRRATHNEVERRRRDKINTWIMKLAGVVPDCTQDQSKQGQSKGGILSKTLDYIVKLRTSNERMAETLKDHERLMVENQVLRQQIEEQRRDNALLRAGLLQQQQQQQAQQQQQQQQQQQHDQSNVLEEVQKMDSST